MSGYRNTSVTDRGMVNICAAFTLRLLAIDDDGVVRMRDPIIFESELLFALMLGTNSAYAIVVAQGRMDYLDSRSFASSSPMSNGTLQSWDECVCISTA